MINFQWRTLAGIGVLTTTLLFQSTRCSAQSAHTIEKLTLNTGLRAVVRHEPNSRTLAISVFVGAGVAEDGNQPGMGAVVARALFGSNSNQSREEVAHSIYDVGGNLETEWNPDYTLFTCVTAPERMEDALYVICQALKGAQFDPVSFENARAEVLNDIDRAGRNPFLSAYAALRQRMYRESPYRESFGGTAGSLRRITADGARKFYRQHYSAANTVFSVVGNVRGPRVRRALENYLDDYGGVSPPVQRLREPEMLTESATISRHQPTNTATLVAGFSGPGLRHPDYPAFALLSAIIGGGKSSRMWRAVRDTAGIGYIVRAQAPPLLRETQLTLHLEYDPARPGLDGSKLDPQAAGELMNSTAKSVLRDPPTELELDRAKSYTLGGYALAHQRVRDRAFYPGWYEIMGLGFDYDFDFPAKVAAISLDQVKAVAAKYLQRQVLVTLLPGR